MSFVDVKIIDNSKEAVDEVELGLQRALEIIGIKMERYASMLCPVGTPESTGIAGYMGETLRNSISYATSIHDGLTIKVEKGKGDPRAENHGGKKVTASTDEENTVFVGTNVFYAPYVELGTSKMKPRPFLKPSVENHISEYKNIIQKELKKVGK